MAFQGRTGRSCISHCTGYSFTEKYRAVLPSFLEIYYLRLFELLHLGCYYFGGLKDNNEAVHLEIFEGPYASAVYLLWSGEQVT